MATLAVRPLAPRDIPHLGRVNQRIDLLDMLGNSESIPDLLDRVTALVTPRGERERTYVALVDGELCAYLSIRPAERTFRWDVTAVAAGSPRLDATDAVCIELWSAILEYVIRRAGEAGAKRLFATAREDGPTSDSLRAVGFEPYTEVVLLRGAVESSLVALPSGMRPQEESDVWSIHQLYHRTTPHPVQFAEALTSTAWELPKRPRWMPGGLYRSTVSAFVLETTEGIEAFCRIEQQAHRALATILVSPACHDQVQSFVNASALEAANRRSVPLDVVVTGYQIDLVRQFEEAGFQVLDERVAYVRHTTVPALVHTRLSPLSAVESSERLPKGVPSYFH